MSLDGVCVQASQRVPPKLFSFMNPLAVEIWLYILGAYALVSLTIWLLARFSPREWRPPAGPPPYVYEGCACDVEEHPRTRTLAFVENDFTLANSFWFAIGTLMQQGSDLNPRVR